MMRSERLARIYNDFNIKQTLIDDTPNEQIIQKFTYG